MRVRAALLGLTLLAASAAFVDAPVAHGQPPDPSYVPPSTVGEDPAIRDLSLAESRITETLGEIDRLEALVDRDLDEIERILIDRELLDVNAPARARTLAQARADARNSSVAAYLGFGVTGTGLNPVDATSISDAAFRNALIRQLAERVNEHAYIYSVLTAEADESVTGLSNELDVINRRVEDYRREIAELQERLPGLRWIEWIASINAEADQILSEKQRLDPSEEQWAQLRFCESTDDYQARTNFTVDANAFGAYQFEVETWQNNVGGVGNPLDAHPLEQDARARLLYAKRGRQPWPICGRYLHGGG